MEPIEQAKKDIDKAAAEAVRVIASAASEASHVIANAAAEAAKVASLQSSSDHDILIELKTKMVDLKSDIKDIKDGTSDRLARCESRLSALELTKSGDEQKVRSQDNLMKTLIGVVLLLISLTVWHITGYKI